jgi:STE24 endopeptidase
VANEDKSTRYHRARRRAEAAAALVSAAFFGLAVVTGLSTAIRDVVVGSAGGVGIAAAAGYSAILATLHELLQLPFSYQLEVRLDRRYRLSSQTDAQWMREQLADSITVVTLGTGIAVLIWELLRSAPDGWWITAAVLLAGILVVVAQLAPAWLPAADEMQPLGNRVLAERLQALGRRCQTQVADIAVWQVSKRTRKASAMLVGLGRTRRILLSDTLLAEHGDDEVEVIVAHEFAHVVYHDAWISLAMQAAILVTGCYGADRLLTVAAGSPGITGKADLVALPLVALAGWLASTLWRPLGNLLSQLQERRADRFAIAMTGNAGALVKALRHLATVNLAEDRPSSLADLFLNTHPSLGARIRAAQSLAGPRVGDTAARVAR